MKNVCFTLLLVVSSFLLVSVAYAADTNILLQIKSNYRQILLPTKDNQDSLKTDLIKFKPETEISDQVVEELHLLYPFDLKKIEGYLSLLQTDGSWKDINYDDRLRSGWAPKKHASRILELSKLYNSKDTKYYHSPRIKKAIHSALNFWFVRKPVCPNWWYNEIGIPKTLGCAFLLLEDQLSAKEKSSAIEVMKNSRFGMTGQNKVWLAGNVLIRALLQNDSVLAKAARDTIVSEIVLGRREGIKNDWSFHQHGPQQQFGNYGLAFVSGMSFYNRLFKDTVFALSKRQKDILYSLINKGYRWIIWNRYMDVSALDRQFFRKAQIHKAYSLALAAADLGIGGFNAQGNSFIGHKHFDDSDYTLHRTKNWMASVKMSSNRVIGTELVNEDNLKGYYLGDGATYYYRKGDEYSDIFPLWDWRRIPGTTAYQDVSALPNISKTKSGNNSDKVGGLTVGNFGMTAMELNRDGLKGNKAWLFSDRFVFCLGADIKSDSALVVNTTIDQRWLRGEFSFLKNDAWGALQGTETFCKPDLRFYYDGTGYIVLNSDSCTAKSEERSGQWCDIMGMYQPALEKGKVMTLFLNHGARPQGKSYQYVVIPVSSKDDVKTFDIRGIRIIRNDSSAQILSCKDCGNGYWAAVYKPTLLDMDGLSFNAETVGIYYLEKDTEGLHCTRTAPFRLTK